MAKIGAKEIQARALREAQYGSRGGGESRPAGRRVADKATPIVRTGEVTGKPIGAQDGPKNLPVAGVASGPRGTKAKSGSTTHQYRDPEKRKAYMAKYMRDRRKRMAEKRGAE